MATNNVKSPAASLATQFKAPSLPNNYDSVKQFNPMSGIDEKVVDTNAEFATKETAAFSQFKAQPKVTRTTGVGTTSVDVDLQNRKDYKDIVTSSAESSSIEARIAQGEGLFDFTAQPKKENTLENFDIDSLGNIKLSTYDAQKRIDDFNNPKSKLAETFKASLGEKRYEFAKLVEDVKRESERRAYIEASQGAYNRTVSDMTEAASEQGITGIISAIPTKGLDYAFGDNQYETNKYAKQYNIATGKETTSPIAEGLFTFGVNAPFYMAMGNLSGGAALARIGSIGRTTKVVRGAGDISRTLPTTGNLGLTKFASNLETMSMKYPTLYAATVDNALTTSLEYTGRKGLGMDTSGFTSDLLAGLALPVGFKGLGAAYTRISKVISGLNPKDVNTLEKALFEEVQASVDKNPNTALTNMMAKGETYFEDGTTLTSRIEEHNKLMEAEKQRVSPLSAEEVISEFSKKGITTTKAGGRMIADAINKLNEGIKGEDVMGTGYGDVGADGKSLLTKQAIINNLTEGKVANEENVAKAIEDAKNANGVELDVKRSELSEEEQFEELLSNPDNNIENLLDAKNAADVKAAVEGAKNAKKATKEGLDGLRFATDTGELKLEELQAIADEQGVTINPKKLYKPQSPLETKAPELDKDYINKIIDEVELKRTGYSGIKSTVINNFKIGINAAVEKAKTIIGQTTGDNYKPKYLRGEGVGRGKVDVNKLTLSELDEFNAGKGTLDIQGKKAKAAADKAIKAMAVAIRKEGNELAIRLKNAVKATEKVKIQKLIDANKAKIVELKKKATYKDKIKTNFVKYVKNSIDNAGSTYTRSYFRPASSAKQVESAQVAALRGQTPRAIRTEAGTATETILSKSTINSIKNKYKALIHPTTSVARATELMKRMDEELHKLSYDKMEKDADTLITKVMNAATHKKNKATVDINSVMKMADTYIKMQKAGGDIDKMRDLIVDLEEFHRLGKDKFKANIVEKKIEVSSVVKDGLSVLDRLGESMFGIRGRNTPTAGSLGGIEVVNKAISWWSNSVSADLNIRRLFGPAKGLVKVFIGKFQEAQTFFTNIRRDVVDIHGVNALREANKLLKTNEGDASYKLTLWMRRDTDFGKEGNMMSNMTMKRTGAGKWQVLFVNDPSAHMNAKKAEYDRGNYIYFGNEGNDVLKESILEGIYRPFDEAMSRGGKFKQEIDWINSHFSSTGDDIIDIGKRSFNKIDFHKQQHYFPSAIKNKVGEDSAIDAQGQYDSNMQESIQNGFLKNKVKPSADNIRNMEMGFVENLAYHTDTAVWWKLNIENLITADATLRQLRKGRKGVNEAAESIKIEEENLFDMSKFTKDEGSSASNLDNPMLTLEAERYLRDHIGKIATRGRSINNFSADAGFLNRLLNHANKVILGVPEVALKQTMGYPVIGLHAGTKNMVGGFRNSTGNNLIFAYKASGTLMERQPTIRSKEGRGIAHFVTQNDTWTKVFGKIERGYDQTMEALIGNTTKLVDGAISGNAWMAGMSKYLDEQGIVKSGSKYDLEEIAIKLGDEKWQEAVAYSDEMMGRIMGSNTLVDKAILANSMLTKTTMLFMRTGLHQMVSAFDTLAEVAGSSKFKGDSKTRQHLLRVAQGGKIFMASIAVATMNETFNELRVYTKRLMGVKEEKDQFATRELISGQVIEDPTDTEIAMDIAKRYITSITASPSLSPDILAGYSGMFTGIQKVMSAPTLDRQNEELSYALLRGFVPSTYADLIRWGVTKGGIGLNPVDAKTYDTAANAVKEQYGGNDKNKENDKWNSLDKKKRDELISTQIQKNEINKETSELDKPKKESEDKFINESLNKYGKDITLPQFINSFNDTEDKKFFEGKSVDDLESMYNKVKLSGAKKSGERDSILMGLDASEIFKLELQPMIDEGKIEEAFKRWNEMYKEDGTGVFKSVKGYNQVGEMMVIYQNQN